MLPRTRLVPLAFLLLLFALLCCSVPTVGAVGGASAAIDLMKISGQFEGAGESPALGGESVAASSGGPSETKDECPAEGSGRSGGRNGRRKKEKEYDVHCDEEVEFVNHVFGFFSRKARNIGDAVGITGDTVAALAGLPLKSIGAMTIGLSDMIEGASKNLDTREKDKESIRVAATAAVGAERGGGGAAKGRGGSKGEERHGESDGDPISGLSHLGRNTLSDLLKVTGTVARGAGQVVFQVGAVAESFTSNTGQVVKDVVRLGERGIDSMGGLMTLEGMPTAKQQMEERLRQGQGAASLNSAEQQALLAELELEKRQSEAAEAGAVSVGWLQHAAGMLWTELGLCWAALFLSIEGVEPFSYHLGAALLLLVWRWGKCRRRRYKLLLLFSCWLYLSYIDQSHRSKLAWKVEHAAYRRASLEKLELLGSTWSRGSSSSSTSSSSHDAPAHAHGTRSGDKDTADLESDTSQPQPHPQGESAMWLNHLVQEMWSKGLGQYVSNEIGLQVTEVLEEMGRQQSVYVEVTALDLGATVPVLRSVAILSSKDVPPGVTMSKRPTSKMIHFGLDLDSVSKDMNIVIDIKLSSLENAKLPSGSLLLSELLVKGSLTLSLELLPRYPFVGNMYVSIRHVPDVSVHMTGAGLEVLSLGNMDSALRIAIQAACRLYMWPLYLPIDAEELICPECVAAAADGGGGGQVSPFALSGAAGVVGGPDLTKMRKRDKAMHIVKNLPKALKGRAGDNTT